MVGSKAMVPAAAVEGAAVPFTRPDALPSEQPADGTPEGPAAPATEQTRFAALYTELHRIARREARRYGAASPLNTTTLLHDAYMQVARRGTLSFPDDRRFLAYAARTMRGVVIDRLRARGAIKRGGAVDFTTLNTLTGAEIADTGALEEVSAALDDLAALEPDLGTVVDLRFFCGFTMEEIAAQRGVSLRTVQRQWDKARGYLFMRLKGRE